MKKCGEAGRKLGWQRWDAASGRRRKKEEEGGRNGAESCELLVGEAGLSSYVMLECGSGSGEAEDGCSGSPWMRPSAGRRGEEGRGGGGHRDGPEAKTSIYTEAGEKKL